MSSTANIALSPVIPTYTPQVASVDKSRSEQIADRLAARLKDFDHLGETITGGASTPKPLSSHVIKRMRYQTTYVDKNGKLLSKRAITDKIKAKVSGIYSVDSVTTNSGNFIFGGHKIAVPAIEIKIQRTFTLYDLIPLGVFLPALYKDSVYRKTVSTSTIQDFLLNAKPLETEFYALLQSSKEALQSSNIPENELEEFNRILKQKYDADDEEYQITHQDLIGRSALFEQNLELFANEFRTRYSNYVGEGRKDIYTTFWKAQSITMYLPEDLSGNLTAYIEVPKNSGVCTTMAIACAKFFNPDPINTVRL